MTKCQYKIPTKGSLCSDMRNLTPKQKEKLASLQNKITPTKAPTHQNPSKCY